MEEGAGNVLKLIVMMVTQLRTKKHIIGKHVNYISVAFLLKKVN